jgi:hypothetical protein
MDSALINLIKEDLLSMIGKKIQYGKDCNKLSKQIFEVTNRQVSSSTLKRFFGLIDSPFKPSKYTMDTLAVFLGFKDWNAYLNSFDESKHSIPNAETWDLLKRRALLLTEHSLSSLKQKTGYKPETNEIRLFAEKKIEAFMEASQTATMFVAPDGYGKSTILIQLAERYFLSSEAICKDDILILIDGGIFFNLYSKNPEVDLLNQLIEFNMNSSLDYYFRNNHGQRKGRIWLIIDDVDEIFFMKERYHQFVENLMRMIMFNKENSWFKIILTCRPGHIDIFTYLTNKYPLFKSSWFGVNFCGDQMIKTINVPLFNKNEIKSLLNKLNFEHSYDYLSFHHSEVLDIICYPYFLSLFVLEYKHNENISDISLLDSFISERFISPPNREEKLFLIDKFFELCDWGKETNSVNKELLLSDARHLLAYHELISHGIIYEYTIPEGVMGQQIYVEFNQNIVFVFVLFTMWRRKKSLNMDLFHEIREYYQHNLQLKCKLMSVLAKILLSKNNYGIIKQLHVEIENSITLPLNSSVQLPSCIISIAHVIRETLFANFQCRDSLMPWFAQSKLGQILYFGDFFDMNSFLIYSDESLEIYLKNNNTASGRAFVYYMRFMQGFLANDQDKCFAEYLNVKQLNVMEIENPSFASYFYGVHIIYQSFFLKKIDPDFLDDVFAYSAWIENKEILSVDSFLQFKFLQFKFSVIFNLNLCERFNEVLLFAEHLEGKYDFSPSETSYFYLFYKLCYARALLHSTQVQKAIEIYEQIDMISFPVNMKYYIQLNADFIIVEFLIYQNKYGEALELISKIKSGSSLLRFNYFYDRAIMLERELMQKKIL